MVKQQLNQIITGKDLSEQEAYQVMNAIMSGEVSPSQLGSLLTALRLKGETVPEIVGFAKAMRAHMNKVDFDSEELLDTCGTGGDGQSTFNISTAVAIILASIGVKVAKHGNRKVSSSSGSADVLEKLGISIETTPEDSKHALQQKGMSFLFAPLYHSAMKHAASTRRDLGFRTIFNLLGPISNPAVTKRQLIGIYDRHYAVKMAQALHELGSKHVMFVTGRDGLDEISIATETDVVELIDGEIKQYTIKPEDVGLSRGSLDDLQVQNPEESAQLIQRIFEGKANESAMNIVYINAGSALYVAGKVTSISEGVHRIREAIKDGTVMNYLLFLQKEGKAQKYA